MTERRASPPHPSPLRPLPPAIARPSNAPALRSRPRPPASVSPASARPSPSAEFSSLKPRIIRILRKHHVKRAGIFGSFARGEQKKRSDVDILASLPRSYSIFDVIGVKLELEDALRRKVDLVDYHVIKPALKSSILADEVRLI